MENRKWEGYWRLGNNHGFRREENACISTPIVEGGRDLKVSHIIDPSTIFGTIISLANCFCQKMPMQFLESPSYQWYKRILEFGHWIKTICTLYQVLIILIMKKFVNYDDMIAEGDWKFRLEWSCFLASVQEFVTNKRQTPNHQRSILSNYLPSKQHECGVYCSHFCYVPRKLWLLENS